MKKKNTKLTLVDAPVKVKDEKLNSFKQLREAAKLTKPEIVERVRVLRKQLEAAKLRYDGALVDNLTDGIPLSLDICDVNREPYSAVFYLSPAIEVLFQHMQKGFFPSCESDDVGELTFWSTQIAISIGMLAGAIYADSPRPVIDRFERGLAYSIGARHWEVADEKNEHRP